MKILYIVGTPIGNLEDITLRALRVLGEAAVVVCEDTRVTSKLLKHYNLSKPLKRFDSHSRMPDLDGYDKVAYVSDAGTPGVSDPGAALVAYAREQGAEVVAIPGPSAVAALVSIAGKEVGEFVFRAFAPHKKGRETFFKQVATDLTENELATIFYEAPTRVIKALTLLEKFAPSSHVIIGRELTKKFEEVLEGTPTELVSLLTTNPEKIRGEFVILIAPN
ncbi:MAG TPA: 16S rRNA (cytidine(1402)-2'-O)-methyltransferase [Candidatus Paceibacterota bacterium]